MLCVLSDHGEQALLYEARGFMQKLDELEVKWLESEVA